MTTNRIKPVHRTRLIVLQTQRGAIFRAPFPYIRLMFRIQFHLLFAFFVLIFLSSCDISKRYVKAGDAFLLQSNYDEAANQYYNALLVKPDNTLAKNGLKHAGQLVLDAKFANFSRFVLENNAPEAVRQYIYNQKYYNRVKSVQVDLNWPSMYNEVYDDIKNEYIGKLYDQGVQFMNDKKYDRAESTFTQIAEIDSDYKDVTVLRTNSIVEPVYQRGQKMMQAENFKEAYRCFDKVCNYDITYKEARRLKQDALAKAIVGVGIAATRNFTPTDKAEQLFNQKLVSKMVKANNPFLKVVDRNNLDVYLNEQQMGMNAGIDPNSVAKAGKILGLKYILMTTLNEMYPSVIPVKTEVKEGYEAYKESVQAPGGIQQYITRFKKVNYTESYQQRKVFYRVFYQLVSVQTAEVVASDVLLVERKDEQYFSKFDGNPQSLYPVKPENNVLPPVDPQWRKRFNETPRELQSIDYLSDLCTDELIQRIVADISTYIEQ